MTEYYLDPEDIITDFLRVNLIDPRNRAESTETQTFSPLLSTKEITLGNSSLGSISCITEVLVDEVSKKKWKDYYWDYQNKKLIFNIAFTGSEEVKITYKYGLTNWIYSDRPNDKLSSTSFPRISLFTVSSNGLRLGQYEAPVESNVILQIDLWIKENQVFTIDNRKYSNEYLSRYLGNQVVKAFELYEENLHPILYNYIPVSNPRNAPYSEEFQAFHTITEISLKLLRIGRIEV